MRKHCLRTTFEAHTFLTLGQGWQMASERRTAVRLYDGALHVQDVLLAGQLRGDELALGEQQPRVRFRGGSDGMEPECMSARP